MGTQAKPQGLKPALGRKADFASSEELAPPTKVGGFHEVAPPALADLKIGHYKPKSTQAEAYATCLKARRQNPRSGQLGRAATDQPIGFAVVTRERLWLGNCPSFYGEVSEESVDPPFAKHRRRMGHPGEEKRTGLKTGHYRQEPTCKTGM